MEHVKVIDGEVDCGWEWSADDPVTSVEVSMAHMHEAFNARIQARKRAAEVAAERAREASETVAPGLARAAAPPQGLLRAEDLSVGFTPALREAHLWATIAAPDPRKARRRP